MKALKSVFEKRKNILSVYFTAGYPKLDDTGKIIKSLQKSGADIIEVGIPYSDPMADGETIQKSSSIALSNGINLDIVFEQLKAIKDIDTPLVIMGYLNQILVYGIERFLSACTDVGVEAVIIPDLPLDDYEIEYKKVFEKYNCHPVFLVTPQTSEERIRKIDDMSNSFIYSVSSSSITGAKSEINDEQKNYFKRIQKMNLKHPALIGFGISDKQSFDTACKYSSGAIIGSAFINVLSKGSSIESEIKHFVKSIIE